MRFVPVSDRRQSIHFCCDVLGFQEQQIGDDYGVGATAELSLDPLTSVVLACGTLIARASDLILSD
jgi:hypothetical protein